MPLQRKERSKKDMFINSECELLSRHILAREVRSLALALEKGMSECLPFIADPEMSAQAGREGAKLCNILPRDQGENGAAAGL